MRPFCIFAMLVLSGGCRFSWEADVEVGCTELRDWYRDADADQWGLFGDSQEACGPEGQYTARNDRDCDDSDAAITGRTGSICPGDLVPDETGDNDVVGVIVGASEVLVAHSATPLTFARAAEDACGLSGWGGGLFSLSEPNDIVRALDSLPASQAIWAGYIGIVFNPDAPFPAGSPTTGAPHPGQWEFVGGGPVPEARLCTFDGSFGADAGDYDPDLGFLALVGDRPPLEGDGSSSDFCFGTPDEALPDETCGAVGRPCYERRLAHFMCQRTAPPPSDFALPLLTSR